MNVFRASRLIVAALSVFALAGCGEGGDRERLVPPEYDLTGRWIVVEPVDCVTISGDLSEYQLDQLSLEYEKALLEENLGIRVVQTGNDLELTSLDSGERAEGTISGDQIRFEVSEQRMLEDVNADLYKEVDGTVLNANRIVLTDESNLTLEAGVETVTIGILCTYHTVRLP